VRGSSTPTLATRLSRSQGLEQRAALAWTEAVTLVAESHVPDDVYAELTENFTEKEMVDLTLAIGAINAWNRLAIGFRKMPTA